MELTSFRTTFGKDIFQNKYQHKGCEDWPRMAETVTKDVTGGHLESDEQRFIAECIRKMQAIPAGRYLYYAGRPLRYYNNCYLLRGEEDTRQEWDALIKRATSCLMTGGGIGVDYSVFRERGAPLKRTGGIASGPIPLKEIINETGRRVMQGGSRRSAIYASMNWQHPDIYRPNAEPSRSFLTAKNWHNMRIPGTNITIADAKKEDFNYPAPLDMTNISPNYDDAFLCQLYGISQEELENNRNLLLDFEIKELPEVFLKNVEQALMTGEPGFSFNFFEKENETLRNACTEVTSADDSDVCNLASINMGQIDTIEQFRNVVRGMTRFLVCGTMEADLPYSKVEKVREKNRRLGLGLMGVHEWLMKRGYNYEVVPELHRWLEVYKEESTKAANELCDEIGISRPKGIRAIAPTGSIGILAGTTTGIEPLFATAFKRRYLKNGNEWHYQYVIDGVAKTMIEDYDLDPENIETALDLAGDPERRIKFQYDIQKYVDHSISSTINLPAWGTEGFSSSKEGVKDFAHTLAKYAHGLRGMTVYPDGARGGQPLSSVPYEEALGNTGEEFKEEAFDVCELTKGGHCGV